MYLSLSDSLLKLTQVPVVIVRNKVDLCAEELSTPSVSWESELALIMHRFKEVDTGIECSAKTSLNVSEVIYFAQKAVLHPIAPIYDSREHKLKNSCAIALKRIFRICDLDKDGILSDGELNEFQKKSFNSPLQQQELEGIRDLVRTGCPEGITDNGLLLEGFLYIHTLFVQRARAETTWTSLRRFGYDDSLNLREDILEPSFIVPPDSVVELSPAGYQFFTELFMSFDQDKDAALSPDEFAELFSITPGNPWEDMGFPDSTITTESGWVTLRGFLAQWSLTTLLDYKTTLAYLVYLGFGDDATKGLKLSRKDPRKSSKLQRSVLLCYIFGAAGSGKSSLLRAFVEKPLLEYQPTSRPFTVVNSVEIDGSEKYLILQEVGSKYEEDLITDPLRIQLCDLLCFVYDSSDPNSFTYIVQLRKKYALDRYPSVFVATKSDLDLVRQKSEVQPDLYCRQLGLSPPLSVCAKDQQTADLFSILTQVAMNPWTAMPMNQARFWWNRFYAKLSKHSRKGGIMAIGIAVVGILIYRFWRGGTPSIGNSNTSWTGTVKSSTN